MNNACTPLDLEIREFSAYKLIIDARSPREFAEDHIPGAINYPVVNDDEYAEVGTMHRTDPHAAYVRGVTYSLQNMANFIGEIARCHGRSSPILVYCFRGGKRSKLWADNLKTIGYKVDVLRGGWKNYRRWVINGLEAVPRGLTFKVVSGPTGSGKSRLLRAIQNQGGQVVDLEGLASHRGSLLGALPGHPQPPQKRFDSLLLDRLRHLDARRPVFIESESKKIGNVQLPESLMAAMAQAEIIRISAPMSERVKVWGEDFGHFVQDPELLLSRITHLAPFVGNARIKSWNDMARSGQVLRVFEELMSQHYDPAYRRSNARLFLGRDERPVMALASVDAASMDAAAAQLLAQYGFIE